MSTASDAWRPAKRSACSSGRQTGNALLTTVAVSCAALPPTLTRRNVSVCEKKSLRSQTTEEEDEQERKKERKKERNNNNNNQRWTGIAEKCEILRARAVSRRRANHGNKYCTVVRLCARRQTMRAGTRTRAAGGGRRGRHTAQHGESQTHALAIVFMLLFSM